MIAQIQMRRGTTAEWAAAAPVVLAEGEPGYDSALKRFKIGDGATAFSALEWNTILPYPVGAIYMSVDSTSPATLFGGTWAALGGRMLIGVDGTYTAGSTGGAATQNHGLSAGYAAAASSAVNTSIYFKTKSLTAWGATRKGIGASDGVADTTSVNVGTELGGLTDDASNLPPYLSVFMWKRTA